MELAGLRRLLCALEIKSQGQSSLQTNEPDAFPPKALCPCAPRPSSGHGRLSICLLRAWLTSRELAHNSHGDVGTGTGAPQPAAALDPVAAVVAQHARAQARGSPV